MPILPKIKLALVDDHKLFRKGVVSLIETYYHDEYEIILEAENGIDLLNQLQQSVVPDIVLMDIEMPHQNGYETMATVRLAYPDIKVLVVSQVEGEEALVKMLRLGVRGYLGKDIDPDELHKALQEINRKGFYYTDFITGKLIHKLQKENNELVDLHEKNEAILNTLNEKEKTFITLSCSELTYEEIAQKMFLSPKTVDGYRYRLFEKFGVTNRVGLVIFAIKNGLVML